MTAVSSGPNSTPLANIPIQKKGSINSITNPNPVYSHSYTWQYYLIKSFYYTIMKLTLVVWRYKNRRIYVEIRIYNIKINAVNSTWERAEFIRIIHVSSTLKVVTSAPRVFKRVFIFLCWVYGLKTINLKLPDQCLIKSCASLSMRGRLTIPSQGFHLFMFWESDFLSVRLEMDGVSRIGFHGNSHLPSFVSC
jgi:hypothetical protein